MLNLGVFSLFLSLWGNVSVQIRLVHFFIERDQKWNQKVYFSGTFGVEERKVEQSWLISLSQERTSDSLTPKITSPPLGCLIISKQINSSNKIQQNCFQTYKILLVLPYHNDGANLLWRSSMWIEMFTYEVLLCFSVQSLISMPRYCWFGFSLSL